MAGLQGPRFGFSGKFPTAQGKGEGYMSHSRLVWDRGPILYSLIRC